MRKAQLIFLLLVGLLAFNSCSDDDTQPNLKFGDLPLSSQKFLTEYFPDNNVISISNEAPDLSKTRSIGAETNKESSYFYVSLESNIYVTFSQHSGNWIDISAANGVPLSATKILDEHVYNALMRKEPQAKITTLIPLYDHSITITLENGHRYAQTQLLAYSGTTLAEANITDESVVSKLKDFLKRNTIYSENAISSVFKITEKEGTAYRWFAGDALTISFDENVNWIHGEVNQFSSNAVSAQTLLSKIAKNEMPASVYEAIINSQNNLGEMQIAASYGNGNYGLRFKNKDLLVNKDAGIIPTRIEKANKLVSDYYDSSYKLREGDHLTLVGAYDFSTTFYYVSNDKSICIETNLTGDWTFISEELVEKDKIVRIALPSKIIEALPVVTANYIKENYKDKDIYYLSHDIYTKGYIVYIDKMYQLYFNEDGSYKTMVKMWQ